MNYNVFEVNKYCQCYMNYLKYMYGIKNFCGWQNQLASFFFFFRTKKFLVPFFKEDITLNKIKKTSQIQEKNQHADRIGNPDESQRGKALGMIYLSATES